MSKLSSELRLRMNCHSGHVVVDVVVVVVVVDVVGGISERRGLIQGNDAFLDTE